MKSSRASSEQPSRKRSARNAIDQKNGLVHNQNNYDNNDGNDNDDNDDQEYSGVKRSRVGAENNGDDIDELESTLDFKTVFSVVEMIAVPLDFVLYVPATLNSDSATTLGKNGSHNNNNNNKPLLSRAEAQCSVAIALLAHELDSLVAVSAQAVLEQRQIYRSWQQRLVHARPRHPPLLALLPLLHVLGERLPGQTLQHIQIELDSVLSELKMASANLRQFAEQNWNLAESLLDAHEECAATTTTSTGERLALQKQKLADIQEEVCRRIDKIVMLQHDTKQSQQNGMEVDEDHVADDEEMVRIQEYCEQVLSRTEMPFHSSPARSAASSSTKSAHRSLNFTESQNLMIELSAASNKPFDENNATQKPQQAATLDNYQTPGNSQNESQLD